MLSSWEFVRSLSLCKEGRKYDRPWVEASTLGKQRSLFKIFSSQEMKKKTFWAYSIEPFNTCQEKKPFHYAHRCKKEIRPSFLNNRFNGESLIFKIELQIIMLFITIPILRSCLFNDVICRLFKKKLIKIHKIVS